MEHASIFLNHDLYDEEIKNIVKYLELYSIESKLLKKYRKNIFEFYKKHPVLLEQNIVELQRLVYNYWHIQFIYIVLKNRENSFEDSTFHKYFIASTRIIEFTIFLLSKGDNLYPFLAEDNKKVLFYYFKSLDTKLVEKYFAIVKDGKNKIIVFSKQYESELVIQPAVKSKIQTDGEDNAITFAFYFKLEDRYVEKIYNFDESKNMIDGRHPNGGRWERAEIQTRKEYEQYLLTTDVPRERNGEDNLIEASLEAHNRKNKLSTIELIQCNLDFDKKDINIDNLSKVNIDSPFKRYQINKAIGQAIAKNNLTLRSKYTIPEIEILSDFISDISSDNTLSVNIILLTVLTGIDSEKIIDALAGFDTQLIFLKQESKFRIKTSKKLFSNFDNSEEVRKEVSNEYVEIYIPLVLARVWMESVREISDVYKNMISRMLREDVEEITKNIESEKNNAAVIHKKLMKQLDRDNKYFEEINNVGKKLKEYLVEQTKEYLQNKIKKYPKKIVLPYNTLSSIFLHLYKTTKINSDIGLLFSGVMSKNDEARVCYGAVPKRLIIYEKWQKELLVICKLEDIFLNKYGIKIQVNQKKMEYNQKWYGSKLYFNGTKFNIFLQKLLALSCTNELDRLNLKFIFIKYALSCLLATRHYKYSTSMEQYSRRESIMLIQEKGRNLFSGKRIIPLTEQAVEVIEAFLELKKEYGIVSYSPCIVSYLKNGNKKEKIMRRGDIESWFNERKNDNNSDEIDYILKFITKVPLNFGRHVFTSIALQDSKLSSGYLDAFLGHYKMGTEDQGIYSNFNNEAYYKEIRQIMNEIGMEYLPNDWKDIW